LHDLAFAVAVGNLREPGQIEIHDVSQAFFMHKKGSEKPIACLKYHTDMIDIMLKIEIPRLESTKIAAK
jgi:hypothetical protein